MPRFLEPNQKIKGYSTFRLVRDVLRYVKPYRGRFWLGSVLRLFSDLLSLLVIFSLAQVINLLSRGNFAQSTTSIHNFIILLIISSVGALILRYFAKLLVFYVAEQVDVDVERQAITHLFKLNIAWHEKENTGNKLKRINNAANGYARLFRIWVNNIIEICVNFVGVIVIISRFDKTISWILAGFLIVYFLVTKLLLKRVAISSYNVNVAGEELNGWEFEAVNNIRTVKIMSMTERVTERLRWLLDVLFEKSKLNIFWLETRFSSTNVLGQVFRWSTMVLIINKIIAGQLSIGFLILFNGYFMRIWESIDELSSVSEDILVARYSISRLRDTLNEPIDIDDEQNKQLFPSNWRTIELRHVSFAYGENEVLTDVSFKIHRGEKIGIVGLSGAGKSTLFKLLLKEYENFTGEILIDGVEIQKISKKDYFNYAAVVLQETEVFNLSLRENIYLAGGKFDPREKSRENELQKSLEIAHVTDFVSKLPQGLDTEIGEKGVRLSGGEKQRLGIARAVFKHPQLLLLDEATSHLDLESEEKIQDSLHQFFKNVTAIVVAHRLTTIKEMDKIIVIEEGRILESGSFAELQAKRGRFYELWEKQRL